MSLTLLVGVALSLATAIALVARRRAEVARLRSNLTEREEAIRTGSNRARLQYPYVDLSRCLGCATCIAACPEEGVLDLVHGQAVVLHGARCVGHGACARECPTGAISVTLQDLSERRDIPALDERFEVPGVSGLFLGGEITGYALIRTAIAHGTAIANEVAERVHSAPDRTEGELDLCVVGAGPAGLACSLQAKARGLNFVTLEQESLGGTVASYPRRKLVMTQPVELPLHGKLDRTSYQKEELIELWQEIAQEEQLPVHTGVQFLGVEGAPGGMLRIRTSQGEISSKHVCLAIGRRGTPRKLGVPGEELPKVAYGLMDAQSFEDRRVLVVGGGDSAVEAALGLAEQSGNRVTISYRRAAFFRLKARNQARVLEARERGNIQFLLETRVRSIELDSVELERIDETHAGELVRIENDDVFVLAGGVPPFELLSGAGVSFDPADRQTVEPITDKGTGLFPALCAALALTLAAIAWVFWFRDYYALEDVGRHASDHHGLLRSSRGAGLGFGVAAAVLIVINLAYLLRRSPAMPVGFGSLKLWMSSHVVTGVLAFVLALLHACLDPHRTAGGHALAALGVLVVTGAIGRYFYSVVPRAANGRELALHEVKTELATLSSKWDRANPELGEQVRTSIDALVAEGQWSGSFLTRLAALLRSRSKIRSTIAPLRKRAESAGLPRSEIASLISLAQRAQRTALMAAHYEDLRALLASWRYLHRWAALLMTLLVGMHVASALAFGEMF